MTRKVILALMIVLSVVSMSSGATSEDMSVYVRKDVFEAKMEAFMAEIRFMNEQTRGEIRALSSRVDGLDKRIDDLRNGLYLWITVITVIFAYIEIRRKRQERGDAKEASAPTMTLEEIKNLVGQMIAENNAKLIKSR